MSTKGVLALSDGTIFEGEAFGKTDLAEPIWGEVVFNTSMYGYQEILTDPSYAGQIMTFTNPQIGNVGCNSLDVESANVHVQGVLIRELSKAVSNFRAEQSLPEYLKENGKVGIAGIDTRKLVKLLRDKGSQVGAIACGDDINTKALVEFAASKDYDAINFVEKVSCKTPYAWNQLPWELKTNSYPTLSDAELSSRPHLVVIDCGVKYNILRLMLKHGFKVTVVPWNYTSDQIAELNPDAVFFSNGPGDPSVLTSIVETAKGLLGRYPIFGICLGHQIVSQALGAKTFKLGFGHRGGNHPVRDETTSKVEITVQNHGYAVKPDKLPETVPVSHLNLNDMTVEGIDIPEMKAFTIQYHPESSPGPHDAQYLFERFYSLATRG